MRLSQLLSNVTILRPYRDYEITSVFVDSEKVAEGGLFIAVRGEKSDGHDYAARALLKGAVCVVAEREIPGIPREKLVITDSCRRAAAMIFSAFYGNPADSMHLAAVTGTNGKTTVAKLCSHILRAAGYKTGTLGTLGADFCPNGGENLLGKTDERGAALTTPTPEYLYRALSEMRKAGCDSAVMEASSHALELSRLDALHFEAGAFLNLSRDHLDFHRTVENYFQAKSRLADMSDSFFVNYDDRWCRRLADENPRAVAFSAIPETAADDRVYATACACRNRGAGGMEYLFYSRDAIFKIRTKMWGMNAVYNSMAASLIALKFGVSPVVIQEATSTFDGVRGRMEVLPRLAGEATFIIDFAHTPDALEKAIGCVRGVMRGGRLLLIFGCGGERDKTKRAPMGTVADSLADFTYVTNDNPRGENPLEIISMIEAGFTRSDNHTVIVRRDEALCRAVFDSRAGDYVLVCGKGHEDYIIDSDGKRYFSEREVIGEALKRKRLEKGGGRGKK